MTLIYSDPTAALLFWLTFLSWVALDIRIVLDSLRGRDRPRRASGDSPSGSSPLVGLAGIWVGIAAGFAVANVHAFVLPYKWALLAVGLALTWCGIALRYSAKRALGRFFVCAVSIQEGHRVVSDGPYGIVRHPGYTGSLLSLFGLGLATANVVTTALFFVIPLVLLVRRMRVEEARLVAALGSEYEAFRDSRSRLVPGIY